MYIASEDSSKNYDTFMEMISDNGWTAEDVVNYLTDWHGMYLMSGDFIQNLIDCEL